MQIHDVLFNSGFVVFVALIWFFVTRAIIKFHNSIKVKNAGKFLAIIDDKMKFIHGLLSILLVMVFIFSPMIFNLFSIQVNRGSKIQIVGGLVCSFLSIFYLRSKW
jgi:hypothetical protein